MIKYLTNEWRGGGKPLIILLLIILTINFTAISCSSGSSTDDTGNTTPTDPVPDPVPDPDLAITLTAVSGDTSKVTFDFTMTNTGGTAVDFSVTNVYIDFWVDRSNGAPAYPSTGNGYILINSGILSAGGTGSGSIMLNSSTVSGTAYAQIDFYQRVPDSDTSNNVSPPFVWSSTSGTSYYISTFDNASGCTTAADTLITLWQSDGTTQITENDDGGNGGGTFSEILTLLTAGTYLIRVEEYYSAAGRYSIIVDTSQYDGTASTGTPACPDTSEDGDDVFGGAVSLTVGTAVDRTVDAASGEYDWFSFVVP